MSRDGASNPTAFRETGFPAAASAASAAVAEEAQVVRLAVAAAAETAAVALLCVESFLWVRTPKTPHPERAWRGGTSCLKASRA